MKISYNKNGDNMKRFLSFCIFILLILLVIQYKGEITEFVLLNFVYKNDFNYVNENEYKRENDFSYFKSTDNYKPNNLTDTINIIYSSVNKGYDSFNFYCPISYENCLDDVKYLTDNNEFLSNINNFVHPFNSYNKLNITVNSLGKISIDVDKLYSDNMIKELNTEIDRVYNNLIRESMTDREKIRVIHDYIINRTKYDQKKADDITNNTSTSLYLSHTAYGPLFQGYGICSGYTDAMTLFLNKMHIPNYKISSATHVWNLVYIDGSWLNLDLTFDDPVYDNGYETVSDKYFLIDTRKLISLDKANHDFDANIFREAIN